MTTFIIYLSVYMHLQEYSRASERGKGEHSSPFIGQLSSLQDGISARASRGDQGIIYLYGLRIYIYFVQIFARYNSSTDIDLYSVYCEQL